jgi:competence protein ComEC
MDDIRQKLALIDKQLAGGPNFLERIISTSPLAIIALGLIAGIVIQNTFDLPVLIWLILLILLAAATALFFIIRCFSTNYQSPISSYLYAVTYLTLACFLCLGAIRLSAFYRAKFDDVRNFIGDEPKLATIRGLIVSEPYIQDSKEWKFARFKHTDPKSSFYLKLREIETTDGWAQASGIIRVQVDGPILDLRAGDYVQAYCWLERFKGASNPGQFDVAKYLMRKNVFVAASVNSREAIEVIQSGTPRGVSHRGGSAGFFVKIKRKAREIAVQSLLGSPYPQDENERLLQALVLGYRAEIDRETYQAFRKTGLLHFVCLSGMNFGIFVGMIWWLCKTAGLTKRGRAVVCIIAAAMFVLVVPSNPPAFRAAIICLVFCSSFFFRRHPNHFNSLALAAIVLLMIKPTDLFDVSWQLSFATVLGILLFYQRILFFLYEKITGRSWFTDLPKTRPFFQIIPRPGPYVLQLFSTSLAAWLASAGILLYNFYTIQPLTSIWTVIASPFIGVISFLGYLKLLVGLVLPTAASILDVIINPLSSCLIWLVKHIARIDVSQVLLGHITIWLIVFCYCTILFIAFIRFKRPLLKKVVSVTMVLAIIIFLGITKWQRTYRDDLVLTCLDVGHGQAVLAQLPGKANILFDAGSLQRADVGSRIIAPFLDYSGISRIDAVVISHNDVDHINGIPEVVEHCKVEHVYANDAFFSGIEQWGTRRFLGDYLAEKGLKIERLDGDFSFSSPTAIKMLWPKGPLGGRQITQEQLSDNDKSLVCLIEFAGRRILLCADIGAYAQAEILRQFPNLKADIVVVPHHGSSETLTKGFLQTPQADILICSCDRRHYERQQKIDGEQQAKWYYTPRDGAIMVHVTKKGAIEAATYATQR